MSYKPPAYQHYAKDFLAGTADMSCAEAGAYIRLLDHAWDGNPICTLPDNDDKLRRMAGADKDEWETIKLAVLPKFRKIEVDGYGARLVNDRLNEYFKELIEHHEAMSERGKKGAAARHGKKTDEDDA